MTDEPTTTLLRPMGPDRNGVLWARAQLRIAIAHLDAALDLAPGRFAVEAVSAAAAPASEAAEWLGQFR